MVNIRKNCAQSRTMERQQTHGMLAPYPAFPQDLKLFCSPWHQNRVAETDTFGAAEGGENVALLLLTVNDFHRDWSTEQLPRVEKVLSDPDRNGCKTLRQKHKFKAALKWNYLFTVIFCGPVDPVGWSIWWLNIFRRWKMPLWWLYEKQLSVYFDGCSIVKSSITRREKKV